MYVHYYFSLLNGVQSTLYMSSTYRLKLLTVLLYFIDTPKIFHTNNNPPNQIYQGEATKALALSSGLSVGLFSMFIFGGCWFYDVSTLKEFSNGISGFFIRHGMGQQIREIENSQDSFGSISDILNDEDN